MRVSLDLKTDFFFFILIQPSIPNDLEELHYLCRTKPKKDALFITGDWNAKVGTQETPGVTGKFGLGMWNEAGQRLI